MTIQVYERYRIALDGRLSILGLSASRATAFGEKVQSFDGDVMAVRYSSKDRSFLLSRGCAKYPGANRGWRDEFLVEESAGEEFSLSLLELTVYYHLTRRPVEPSDVIEIGRIAGNDAGYSHVYSSVPFFLPGSVNAIQMEGANFALQWLMPIFPREAAFIEANGSDKFETRLRSSQYDFFDARLDLDYLN